MTRSLRELRTGSAVLCLLSIVSAAFAQTTGAPATGDIGIYRANADRSGYIDATMTTPLCVLWQNTTARSDENRGGPVADNGVVFYATGNTVYALDETSGSIKWQYPPADVANNPDERSPGVFHGSPCVADGKVFIGNDDDYLYVLDEQSGQDVFQVQTGGPVRSAPIVDNGVVYFGSFDGKLYDIREDNQTPQWGGNFTTEGPVVGPPIVTPDQVIFCDENNNVYDAQKTNGRLLWRYNFAGGIIDSAPLLAGGDVVVGSDKYLIGLSEHNGMLVWQAQLPTVVTNQPASNADGTVFYVPTADSFLNAVDQRGHILWRAPLDSPAGAAATVVGDCVVIALKSGTVLALDAGSGAVEWSYNIDSIAPPGGYGSGQYGTVSASPLVEPGKIFVLSNDSTLTALSSAGVDQLPPVAILSYPTQDQAIPGAQIPYSLILKDAGCGVNPSSIVLKVDGKIIPVSYSVGSETLSVKLVSSGDFAGTPVALATLTNGQHTLSLTAADWRGNILTKTWLFTVNSSLNPQGSPLPPSSTTGSYATQSGNDDEGTGAAAAGAGSGESGGGAQAGGSASGGSGGSGSGGSGGSSGAGGGSSVGSGGSPPNSGGSSNGGGSTNPPPQPPPSSGGGGGGGNGGALPPPPPI